MSTHESGRGIWAIFMLLVVVLIATVARLLAFEL
jgi:hypothetical protein